jgi:hypothetical protein
MPGKPVIPKIYDAAADGSLLKVEDDWIQIKSYEELTVLIYIFWMCPIWLPLLSLIFKL